MKLWKLSETLQLDDRVLLYSHARKDFCLQGEVNELHFWAIGYDRCYGMNFGLQN